MDQDKENLLNVGDSNVSLQDSFKKFLDQKKKERQIQKLCRESSTVGGKRSEEYKNALRSKFIENCKKYIGVPYAERFKKESDPIAPLYLDCCGLVRQAVKDLQEEFGFVIGRWNQAYQFDTLPVVLEESQLKPGDLVFYEGIYNSNRSKPQKHNMVHVEVFIGGETGESTVGSRFHKGCVSIYPSYKFKSSTWDLVQYHFRSLDNWLDGECKSHCCDHAWVSDLLAIDAAAGKRSIFYDNHEDENADDCEVDEEIEVNNDINNNDNSSCACNDSNDERGGGGSDEEGESEALIPSKEVQVPVAAMENTVVADSSNAEAAGEAISLSVAEVAVADLVVKPKRQSSSFGSESGNNNSNNAGTKVGGGGGAKRNTAVSSSTKTALAEATGLNTSTESKRMSEKRSSAASRSTRTATSASLDSLTKVKSSDSTLTYYVCKSNGWQLVKTALDKRGWQQLPFDYNFSAKFSLKWVERRSQIDYKSHTSGQLVCHIPNNEIICSKVGLLNTLRESRGLLLKQKKDSQGSNCRNPCDWIPDTYLLSDATEIATAIRVEEEVAAANEGLGCIWIYKPPCNNRGRGIQVFRDKNLLLEVCNGKDTGNPDTTVAPRRGIIQRYIENPLLVGPVGFKFDVRCYMLIARNDPTCLAFYHPGYCRLTLKPYTCSMESFEDPTVHLTNAAIQKKDALYKDNKDSQIRSLESVAATLAENGNLESAEYMRNKIDEDIKLCMVDVLRAAVPKLQRKHGYFDLLGFDFMVTSENKLVLLEINTNPALSLDNSVLEQLLPNVVDGALQLVLDLQGPNRPAPSASNSSTSRDSKVLESLPYQFQLLLNEASGYTFGG